MAPPQVSVIINTYNDADFIGQAIDSVLNQTLSDLELVIFSNASTDETANLVRRYRDPRIVFHESVRQTSLSQARNQALQLVSGEYICFLDSDDYWARTKLEQQVTWMKDQQVDFCATNFFLVEPTGTKRAYSPRALVKHFLVDPIEINYPVALSTLMFHHSVLTDTPFNPDTQITGDYQLVSQQSTSLRFRVLPEAVSYITLRQDSESNKKPCIMTRELADYAIRLRRQGKRNRGELVLLRALEVAFVRLGFLDTLRFLHETPITFRTFLASPHYLVSRILFLVSNSM